MKILHFISTPYPINYGVWSVVIKSFYALKEQFGAESVLCFPEPAGPLPDEIRHHNWKTLAPEDDALGKALRGYGPDDTVVVTHGNWALPTKWGIALKQQGYRWIASPHGMLEPWSMRHRWLKKQLYYQLLEKPRLNRADAIVAVGRPEYENLSKQFSNVVHIPNGIDPYEGDIAKPEAPIRFLFLGRLHKKKGVLPLVQAWMESELMGNERHELVIAGPEEGESDRIIKILKSDKSRASSFTLRPSVGEGGELRASRSAVVSTKAERFQHANIKLSGPVYGQEKTQLLLSAHFFLLPSHSEGFPTAVLEAMTHGCIPLITEGCNFPEAFEEEVAMRISTEPESIKKGLEQAAALASEQRATLAARAKEFVDTHYNWAGIAEKQYALYRSVLEGQRVDESTG